MKPKKPNNPADAAIEMDAEDDLPPSKTKLKAEADAQQALGVRLSELPKDRLLKLNLPEAVLEAVLESKRITANGAIRRHRQYLGRLMREIDTVPISEQLARWDGKHTAENAYFHGLERWRDRLINDHIAAGEFLNLYPHADSQQLRTLIRNANKELAASKPPKSSRELFKLLREIMEKDAESSEHHDDIDSDDK